MNKKEKREWTIEGLTQLRNIMKYLIKQDNNIYIENPQNFIEALDDALEILKENKVKCYICDEIKEKGHYIEYGYYMQISIEKSEVFENRYFICARGDGQAELVCNYCPKCGRKLNKEIEYG